MLDELILNLTTLGKLRENDKLSVHYGRLYVAPNTFGRALRRKLTGQNRYDVISFIATTINYSIAYAKSITYRNITPTGTEDITIYMLDARSKDELANLYLGFIQALSGLEELKNSYIDDRSAISSIEVICNKISNFVEDCRHL